MGNVASEEKAGFQQINEHTFRKFHRFPETQNGNDETAVNSPGLEP